MLVVASQSAAHAVPPPPDDLYPEEEKALFGRPLVPGVMPTNLHRLPCRLGFGTTRTFLVHVQGFIVDKRVDYTPYEWRVLL